MKKTTINISTLRGTRQHWAPFQNWLWGDANSSQTAFTWELQRMCGIAL